MTDSLLRSATTTLALLLAFAVSPATLAASFQEAQSLLRQGQHTRALDEVNEVIAANPKDRGARFLKGVVLAELNRLDEAAAVFVKLTEEAPELPEPYNNLAVIYAQQKQYDKARTALEMSIRTHPTYATAHENLGDLYTQMARQAYDRALQIDSGNVNAQAKLRLLRDMLTVNNRTAATAPVASPAPVPTRPPVTAASSAAATPPPVAPVAQPAARPASAPSSSSSVATSSATASSKPADKPVAAANPSADVERALEAWAAAWSRKDVKSYLAAYAKDFQIPGGGSRKSWEAEREARIDKPGSIRVSLSNVRIDLEGDKATAQFRQQYNSQTLNSTTPKTIVFVRQGSRWLIQQERTGR